MWPQSWLTAEVTCIGPIGAVLMLHGFSLHPLWFWHRSWQGVLQSITRCCTACFKIAAAFPDQTPASTSLAPVRHAANTCPGCTSQTQCISVQALNVTLTCSAERPHSRCHLSKAQSRLSHPFHMGEPARIEVQCQHRKRKRIKPFHRYSLHTFPLLAFCCAFQGLQLLLRELCQPLGLREKGKGLTMNSFA